MKNCPKCGGPVALCGQVFNYGDQGEVFDPEPCLHPSHAAAQAVVEAAESLERMAGHRVGCPGGSGGPCSCPKGDMGAALAALAEALEQSE